MLNVRKTDPRFIGFEPTTAEEAVDRYVRCRSNGLKAYLVPECLIEGAKGLTPEEMTKFEDWIVNPGDDLSKLKIVEVKAIREANDAVFADNVKRIEARMQTELPPLPMVADPGPIPEDDEKELEMLPIPEDDVMEMRLQEPRPDKGTPSGR